MKEENDRINIEGKIIIKLFKILGAESKIESILCMLWG